MEVTFEIDPDDGQMLAVYIKIKSGEVHRTIIISEGECNADEDEAGNLLGVELLAPGKLQVTVKQQMSERYEDDFQSVLDALRTTKELAI